ncbi:CDP-glycerol glycerophosphotransferase, TagB/SpsB family [Amphibacillus marinus]|uniref:CDP-glycerol glycerophosphotransferase, TagB/SpsB family n=1 Tax=Amphibacillus marinus TaxID=872970 RepID=A0A1H8N483_9BACI|nr:CDP-glycerol glycerophosphotransferase family protein [Amphibacillus marinus]SEO24372.1 CDP-glycerol glycerophosphotransferase, TagB/SpsB family [Amphibacillus marinus]
MLRDFLISLYLLATRLLFSFCKLLPEKNKTTFVASFGLNVDYVSKACLKQIDHQLIILKTAQCQFDFCTDERLLVLPFGTGNAIDFIKSIYHLATSKIVFVDNYYGFLAVTRFRPEVKCIQLWHAAGAIKRFGLKDPTIKTRSAAAHKRFKAVYNRFDHVVVGSDQMANIFKQSFGIEEAKMLKTGIPRTDFFFDLVKLNEAKLSVTKNYPAINGKKVLLYAPTFRDAELSGAKLHLDLALMKQQLGNDYLLMLKLHPAVQNKIELGQDSFIVHVANDQDINDLLTITDLLITDYSSIPFEFSLLNKPMVFYCYDLEAYEQERGFWSDYQLNMPGPVVKTTEGLVAAIKENHFDLTIVQAFAKQWNSYSDGRSSERLVNYIATGMSKVNGQKKKKHLVDS